MIWDCGEPFGLCSRGGLVLGGAFASGVSPLAMREELAKADWDDMFQDDPAYSEINYRNKSISKRFMPGSEIGVSSRCVAYPGGVVAGQKIKLFFNRLVNSDLGEHDIETLPLPLSILATDIGTGERVALRPGSLTKAMRAGIVLDTDRVGRLYTETGLYRLWAIAWRGLQRLPVRRDALKPSVKIGNEWWKRQWKTKQKKTAYFSRSSRKWSRCICRGRWT